jgi:adenylate cyclase
VICNTLSILFRSRIGDGSLPLKARAAAMTIDDRTRIALGRIIRLVMIAAVAGAAYSYITATADGGPGLPGIARGALSGALIGGIISLLDVFVPQAPGAFLTRAPFLLNVGARSLIYLIVFLVGIAAGQWLIPIPSHGGRVHVSRDDILFSFAVMFVVTFLFEVNSLLGQNVLLAFATGRYHRPRVEQRIFLIIDMKDSTAVAERLGEVDFHRLLNRVVNDFTGSIVMQDGQIHKYVGDGLIVTWPLADGLKGARCLRACFGAIGRVRQLGPSYERTFGLRVEFRAALHCGPVVVGEMGSVKKEIALIGDALNTASRIIDAGRDCGEPVIASAALLQQLTLPAGIAARALGPVELRGKKNPVDLFALQVTAAAG